MNNIPSDTKPFGTLSDGSSAHLYRLCSTGKLEAFVTDYGAALVSLTYPAKNGNRLDLVLGYDTAAEYETSDCFFGATVGRSANRIANACFEIDGTTYHLSPNQGENNLHSGPDLYNKRLWQTESVTDSSVTLSLFSPDGDQGYPGNLKISVTYTVTEDDRIRICYHGSCDQATVFNLTNHSYFNLNGHAAGSITDHVVQINSEQYTPVLDSYSIPSGDFASVAGTPFDFREPKMIADGIDAPFEQLVFTGGYDHNYVLKDPSLTCDSARVCSPSSGICLTMRTDLPGMQFYTGNFISEGPGKGNAAYGKRCGFCLETQYYPNSINESRFPSPLMQKGDVETCTEYGFSLIS